MSEYTREALEAVNKDKLLDLANYYELDVTSRHLKAEIVDALVEHFNKTLGVSDVEEKEQEEKELSELPPMSVRVRRIYEQNKEIN